MNAENCLYFTGVSYDMLILSIFSNVLEYSFLDKGATYRNACNDKKVCF